MRGFARKNLETLTADVQELLHASTSPWLRQHRAFVLRTETAAAATAGEAKPHHQPKRRIPGAKPTLVSVATAARGHARSGVGVGVGPASPPPLEHRQSSRLRQASVGEQFRRQLAELIGVIDSSAVPASEHAGTEHAGTGCACVPLHPRTFSDLPRPSLTFHGLL